MYTRNILFAADSTIDNFPSRGYKIGIRNRGATFLVTRPSFYPSLIQSMSVKLTCERHALTALFFLVIIMYHFEIIYFFVTIYVNLNVKLLNNV